MLYTIRYLVFGIQIERPNSTIHIRYSNFLDTVSVLGQDEGYTVIYNPLSEGVPEGKARGNS